MQSLQPEDCVTLWRKLRDERGVSAETQRGALRTLHALLNYAIWKRLILANPLAAVPAEMRPKKVTPRQRQQAHRYLKVEEIKALLEAATDTYRPVFFLAVWTGMRMSEILGLTWCDVDLKDKVLHVSMQPSRASKGHAAERVAVKTDLPRDIDLDDDVVAFLKGLREDAFANGRAKATDYVLTTEVGTPHHFATSARHSTPRPRRRS